MYAADHLPPHFHIIANDGREALVEIATLEVVAGEVGKAAMKEVNNWLATTTIDLSAKWKELNP